MNVPIKSVAQAFTVNDFDVVTTAATKIGVNWCVQNEKLFIAHYKNWERDHKQALIHCIFPWMDIMATSTQKPLGIIGSPIFSA